MTYFAPTQALDRLLRAAVSAVTALSGTPRSAYLAALSSADCARTRRVFTIEGEIRTVAWPPAAWALTSLEDAAVAPAGSAAASAAATATAPIALMEAIVFLSGRRLSTQRKSGPRRSGGAAATRAPRGNRSSGGPS